MAGKTGILLILFLLGISCTAQEVFYVHSGSIKFHSDAPQELIRASSDNLHGAFDVKKKTFIFKVTIVSFMGFNSPLQREHFNENYMESDKYPEAVYSGKVIEDIDLTKDGEYTVRAKGKLRIHGIELERIINARIVAKNGRINIMSDFIVPLSDHNIKIPRVVYDKLASDINVSVNAVLISKS